MYRAVSGSVVSTARLNCVVVFQCGMVLNGEWFYVESGVIEHERAINNTPHCEHTFPSSS